MASLSGGSDPLLDQVLAAAVLDKSGEDRLKLLKDSIRSFVPDTLFRTKAELELVGRLICSNSLPLAVLDGFNQYFEASVHFSSNHCCR